MFKIPKQEYTAEFKELAVKRIQGGEGMAKVARELGAGRADPAQLGQGGQDGQAQSARHQGGDAGADGVVAGAGRERQA